MMDPPPWMSPGALAALDQLNAGVRDLQALIDWLRGAYRKAGAPYGDDDAGLERWVRERVETLKSAPDAPYYPRVDDH